MRELVEEALQESEERYRLLHESLTDAFVMVDMAGSIVDCNTAFQKLLGYTADELRERTYLDLTPERWHAFETRIVATQIVPSGQSDVYEKEYVRKDGTVFPVELRTFLLRDKAGQPAAMWAIVRDITERKQAEDAVKASSQYARSLIEASLDPLVTISAGGKITDVNNATEQVTGVARARLIGSDFADYFTDPERARAGYRQVFLEGAVTGYPLAIRHVSGQVTEVVYNASVYRDQRGEIAGVFAAARDVTELKRSRQELENTNREILTLSQMTDLLQSCQTAEESYPIIGATMANLFSGASGACFILNASGTLLEEVCRWGRAPPMATVFHPDECWGLRRGHLHTVDTHESINPRCRHLRRESMPYVCAPMLAQGKTLGVIYLSADSDADSEALNQRRQHLAETVSHSIGLALANLWLRESLRSLSMHDPLTGLFNRRFMEETLARELTRLDRSGAQLVMAMLDVDRFKEFNDSFGHDAGDFVLKEIAALMLRFRQGSDVACRYGGEEFTLILSDVALDVALECFEQLLLAIGGLSLSHGGRTLPRVTVSMGVACFPAHGGTAGMLIKAADDALYRAKRGGRNRIALAAGVQ